MEPASLNFQLSYKLSSPAIYDFREIFQRIITFYCYRDVTHSDTSITYDPIIQKWFYSFYTYDDNGVILIPSKLKLNIITLNLENYINMKLVSHSVLAYMCDISEKVSFYYRSWGVITEASNLSYVQIRDLRKEIDIYEEKYYYFVKSDSVSEMADKLKIYHTEFDNYTIVKKDVSITKMLNVLGNILLESK